MPQTVQAIWGSQKDITAEIAALARKDPDALTEADAVHVNSLTEFAVGAMRVLCFGGNEEALIVVRDFAGEDVEYAIKGRNNQVTAMTIPLVLQSVMKVTKFDGTKWGNNYGRGMRFTLWGT